MSWKNGVLSAPMLATNAQRSGIPMMMEATQIVAINDSVVVELGQTEVVKLVDFDGNGVEYLAECPYCGIEVSVIGRGAGPVEVEANHCPHFIDVDWYDQKASFGSKEDEKNEIIHETE